MKKISLFIMFIVLLTSLSAGDFDKIQVGEYTIRISPPSKILEYNTPPAEDLKSNICRMDSDTLLIDRGLIWVNHELIGLFSSNEELEMKKGVLYSNGKKYKPMENIGVKEFHSDIATENDVLMGNHRLIVRPYHDNVMNWYGTRNGKEEYFFVIDKYKIAIRNNRLYINFKKLGKLKKRSNVLIDNDKIYINGEEVTL